MTEKESIKKVDFHLFEEILALSVATEWKDAAQEWRLFWLIEQMKARIVYADTSLKRCVS